MRKYVFWWFGAGSDQYPCHLSCWINLIYHLNNLPAQFGRVTSNVNHFSFHNIHMIGMPFKTQLLDLTFENDRVTCFGNRTVMLWIVSLQPGSGQYMPNTSKYPNPLSSQISTGWMHLEINVHCIAFCHFPTVTFIRPCLDPSFAFLDSNSPHVPTLTKHQAFAPSSPMLLPAKSSCVRVAFCFRASANAWQETHDLRSTMKPKAHIPQSCQNLPIVLLISKLRFQMASGITNISNNERRWLITDNYIYIALRILLVCYTLPI